MQPDQKRTSPVDLIAGCLLAGLALFYLRRYMGINHDAALYLGQALLERWPDIFRSDLFFAHGSQGSYTALPWLVSRAFDFATPGTVFLVGTVIGLLCFAASTWFFLYTVLPSKQRYWALLGVLCLPAAYGVVRIFSYGEPFLTSRPLAEAFCLLGLGLLARKRTILGILCAGIALLLHPLQAIAASLIAWPWLVMQNRRWLHALWLVIPITLLGFTNIAPFRDLFQPIDATWLADVRGFTGQLFLGTWNVADFNVLAFDAFILTYAWRKLPTKFGAWCLSALIGLALGMSANLILVDWLNLTLPAALQLWRVHWLAHLFAMASVAALLYHDLNNREPARAFCLGLALILVQNASWPWLLFAALYVAWLRLLGTTPSLVKRTLGLTCVLGMLTLFAVYAANEWLPFRMAHYRLELYAVDRRLLVFPLLALGLPLIGVMVWERCSRAWRRVMLFLALMPLLLAGMIRWDARPPMVTSIENNPFRPNMFGPTIPRYAHVFWVGDLYPSVWLTLHRAEFFSVRQLAGAIFNRGTAVEAHQRLDRVLLAMREDLYCQQQPLKQREACQLDDEAMRIACQPGPTRRPDYMVLPYHQPQRAAGRWDFIDPATGQPAVSYWLYSCAQVMDDLDIHAPVQPR